MNLIVTDFDGTFYDDNYLNNIKFINEYRSNNHFVIATGRNFKSLQKDLKLECDYYICNDGGYILDNKKSLIYKNYIDYKDIEKIYSKIIELDYKEYFFDDILSFSTKPFINTNKASVKIMNINNATDDLNYIVKDLNNVYGYLSNNWINILNKNSDKENAIDYLANLNNYDNIYVVGNDINDYNMLKKYNGYLISNEKNKVFNCINTFLDLKDIIKN